MKTNVTMLSEKDRNLYGIIISQEINDCSLSLTDLQEAYTYARVQNGWKDKRVSDILNYDDNVERIFYLLKEQKLLDSDKNDLSRFYDYVKENGMIKTLKNLKVYRTTGRGENKKAVCNPYIWMLVAMELNPEIYAKVIIWVTDKLIINRIEAGNLYKSLASALYKVKSPDYKTIAIELNKKIFGKHEPGIRNKASKEELYNLSRLEDNIAFLINNGFLKTNEEVIQSIKDCNFSLSKTA